jgi:diguanylate cyclase
VAARAAIPALRDVAMGSSADLVLGTLGIPALGVAEVTFESGAGTRRYSATAFEIEERGRPRGTVVILSDITETHELMAKLERLATTDELTQVDNRRSFFERAERELDIARRKGRAIAFAMLDLDGFKRVNDLRGHAAGDATLVAVCAACRAGLRSTDILCRYGGEEFMIILPEAAPADAIAIIERVRQQIEATSIELGSSSIRVTASFGVSGYAGTGAIEDLETYIRRSDEALYRAKASGRNRVVLHAG